MAMKSPAQPSATQELGLGVQLPREGELTSITEDNLELEQTSASSSEQAHAKHGTTGRESLYLEDMDESESSIDADRIPDSHAAVSKPPKVFDA